MRDEGTYYCEMCGTPVDRPIYYEVEGTVMILCSRCARYGKRVLGPRKPPHKATQKQKWVPRREEILDWELVEDYGLKIRKAREKLGISQEELSRLIGEPLSYVKKIERQKIYPSESVVNRLEKVLNIKLKSSIVQTSGFGSELKATQKSRELEVRLGDILVFRKDKKKSKRK